MGRSFAVTFAKAFLIFYNCVFVLAGFAFLGLGLWMHLDKDLLVYVKATQVTPNGDLVNTASIILLCLGAFVTGMAFLGCCGACCESVCLLCLYSVLLFFILLAEIIGAIVLAAVKGTVSDKVETHMYEQVHNQYNRSANVTDDVTIVWDYMQIRLNCCGSLGPQDYEDSVWFNATKQRNDGSDARSVPPTCCLMTNDDPKYPQTVNAYQCQQDAKMYPDQIVESNALKTTGCYEAIVDWIAQKSVIFISVFCIVIVLQLLGLIFGCCLLARIRNENASRDYETVDLDEKA